jgi:predicted esterase
MSDPPHVGEDGGDGLPPLASTDALVILPVPGFGDAVVSLPRGARAPRPVMLAVHGNYDRPDFQCETWRAIVRDRAFVLCPRGVPRRDSPGPEDVRFTFDGKIAAELDAAIAALHERYGAWVDPGPMLYLGFSLGAILARGYVMRAPARFDRLVLVEGGASGWDARALAKAGAARTLWACGQPSCVNAGRAAAKSFERAGVPSKVVSAKGAGHTYDGPVAAAIGAEWEWLVAGDPRWAP